jgi:hypothetical protein
VSVRLTCLAAVMLAACTSAPRVPADPSAPARLLPALDGPSYDDAGLLVWLSTVDGRELGYGEPAVMPAGSHSLRVRWRLVSRGYNDLPDGEVVVHLAAEAGHRYALRYVRTRDADFEIEIYDEDDFSIVARVGLGPGMSSMHGARMARLACLAARTARAAGA